MREPGAILIGTASVLTLGLAGFALDAPRIEAEIQTRTAAALAEVGVRNLAVQANGRDVTLSGTVAFAEIGIEAERRAQATAGVRRVVNRLETAIGPSFEFVPEGDVWLLRGLMPTPESRQELFDAAAATVGFGNVIDETETGDAVTEPPWISALPRLIQLLRGLDGAPGMALSNGTLALTGHTSSEGLRDRLKFEIAALDDAVGAGWNLADRMRIVPVAINRGAEERIRRLLEPGPIEFVSNTSTLADESRAKVAEIGAALAGFSDIRVEILAHTDAGGDPAANRRSSLQRARAVRDVLAASIRPERLLAFGYGSDRPLAADDSGASSSHGAARIEFRVLHRP